MLVDLYVGYIAKNGRKVITHYKHTLDCGFYFSTRLQQKDGCGKVLNIYSFLTKKMYRTSFCSLYKRLGFSTGAESKDYFNRNPNDILLSLLNDVVFSCDKNRRLLPSIYDSYVQFCEGNKLSFTGKAYILAALKGVEIDI